MGKEKSTVKKINKEARKKAYLLQPEEKVVKSHTTNKSCTNIKNEIKESNEVDSLLFLNNNKERKKLNGIDERIKLLKTELQTLLGNVEIAQNANCDTDKSSTVNNALLSLDAKQPEDLTTDMKPLNDWGNLKESQTSYSREFNQNCNYTSSKFSEWMNKTIDEMDSKSEFKELDANKLVISSKQVDSTSYIFPLDSLPNHPKLSLPNTSFFSQQKVEQLLYKSFLIQNSDFYVYNSEGSDSDANGSTSKTKENCRSRKPQEKFNLGRAVHGHFGTDGRFLKSGVKRRSLHLSSSPSDIEVIDLDSSTGGNKTPKTNIVCVDLDISNYDWNEPFHVKEDTECSLDIQVIEDGVQKNYVNCKNLKLNIPEVADSDISACYDEMGKSQTKKVWECPVCFERSKGQEVVATQCGHVFCRSCLENHISKLSNNCPTCRCDLKEKPFITLFNF